MEITGFGVALLFIVGGSLFLVATLTFGKLIRPNRPNEEKLSTYESGEEPVEGAWGLFNVRFYVVALIFLLFEVELVFLFPWATIFGDASLIEGTQGLWGWFSLTETVIFICLLAVGLVYVWAKGMLNWVKPVRESKEIQSKVSDSMYEEVNRKYQ